MSRICGGIVAGVLLVITAAAAQDANYAVKAATTEPPKELKEPIRKLLSDRSVQFLDAGGNSLAEIWFVQQLTSRATPEQVKNGLTYKELDESTLLGAIRFDQPFSDYRKQKIRPGVYTLRLGFQPEDGDHMGTAPYPDFALLVPAARDVKPGIMDAKELRELSVRATSGSHPAVMLLFPQDKLDPMPKLVDKGEGNLALAVKQDVRAGKEKAALGIALTLVGHTTAE
jgi:hypothetical protein